jgi:GT2 family glycosyltransferase
MNAGLTEAASDIVLFLDDDVRPEPGLVTAHRAAHAEGATLLAAGRAIQPWEEGKVVPERGLFNFASPVPHEVASFIGCNFSLPRRRAVALGGFDENFVRAAYHFEKEFAARWSSAGLPIRFLPTASIHHLKAGSGGTRRFGGHLTTLRPDHAVGAYYYVLRTWKGAASLAEFVRRPIASVATRHHLRHPWWIPLTLVAELRGMAWALLLAAGGARHLGADKAERHG